MSCTLAAVKTVDPSALLSKINCRDCRPAVYSGQRVSRRAQQAPAQAQGAGAGHGGMTWGQDTHAWQGMGAGRAEVYAPSTVERVAVFACIRRRAPGASTVFLAVSSASMRWLVSWSLITQS